VLLSLQSQEWLCHPPFLFVVQNSEETVRDPWSVVGYQLTAGESVIKENVSRRWRIETKRLLNFSDALTAGMIQV